MFDIYDGTIVYMSHILMLLGGVMVSLNDIVQQAGPSSETSSAIDSIVSKLRNISPEAAQLVNELEDLHTMEFTETLESAYQIMLAAP